MAIGHSQTERRKMRDEVDGKEEPGMFRGTNYISGAQLAEERKQANEMALQELKNKGGLDITESEQTGAIKRTGLEQAGMTGRLGTSESGLLQRLGVTEAGASKRLDQVNNASIEQDRRKFLQERFNDLTSDKFDKDGFKIKAGMTPDLARKIVAGDSDAWNQISGQQANNMPGQQAKQSDTIRSFTDAQGIQNFTNRPSPLAQLSNLRSQQNSGNTATPGQATNLEAVGMEPSQTNQAVPINQSVPTKPKETFESIYGDKPLTLENIWAKNNEIQKLKDAKRKKQWTPIY